ncbi:TIGR03086 family metal-binding protein [Nocardioides sp. P5_C9_2]
MTDDAVSTLSVALDQAGELLAGVRADDLDRPTPCTDWSVRELGGHLASSPGRFLASARGESVDFGAPSEVAEGQWATRFRADAAALLEHWQAQPEDARGGVDFTTAELAVHAWDLAQAIDPGRPLDPTVAERALAAMQQGLTPENRAGVFGPAVDLADDAPVHDRLAAWAGRDPR